MSTDPITHNKVARLAADLTSASFVCLVTFENEAANITVAAVSGSNTALYHQVLASARRSDPEWQPASAISIAENEILRALFERRQTQYAKVQEFTRGVISKPLLKSIYSQFDNYWCLAAPIIVSGEVYAALFFVSKRYFTKAQQQSCLDFVEQSQESVASLMEDRSLTSKIDDLLEQRRQVQRNDPLRLTLLHDEDPRTARSFGDIRLWIDTHSVKRGDNEINLTGREFALLDLFLQNPTMALSRNQIESIVWGKNDGSGSNVLSVTIKNLRSKLEAGNRPRVIHSIRGVGYILRAR